MYDTIKSIINNGTYELNDILNKINVMWLQSKITEEQKEELTELARENANISSEVDVVTKLQELDERVKALEKQEVTTPQPEEYPEYVVGKWYYKDDKITFEGQKYVCIAPQEQVCTWSPEGYPTYWQLIE